MLKQIHGSKRKYSARNSDSALHSRNTRHSKLGRKLALSIPLILRLHSTPRKRYVTCLVTSDVAGLGLPSVNIFQPITSFVSIAMLGNEIVVGVTFLGYIIQQKTRDLLSLRILLILNDIVLFYLLIIMS